MSTLPGEVILQVVDNLIPSHSRKIHRPSDIVTKTLISLTLTCKLTHPLSRQLLFRHCLYIDSKDRLDSLLDRSGYFTSNNHNQSIQACSLFLAPFPPESLNEPHIVNQIERLFGRIRTTLQNLVVDMPLRYLYPNEDEQRLRKRLREAFCRLATLEDFCSVQDELFLDALESGDEPGVWLAWPFLRRLALYNPYVESTFVADLQECQTLTHLVIVRADAYMEQPLTTSEAVGIPFSLDRVLVVNTKDDRLRDARLNKASEWHVSFWGCLMFMQSCGMNELVSYVDVPVPPGREDEDISLCQEWLCAQAVDGTLWEFPGVTYPFDYMDECEGE